MQTTICVWVLGSLLCAPTLLSQDADRDSMPDAIELQLGSDPQTPERFTVIWERLVTAQARPPEDPGRSAHRVAVASAGDNRFLWRVEFLADYPKDSLLQLYRPGDWIASTRSLKTRAMSVCGFATAP